MNNLSNHLLIFPENTRDLLLNLCLDKSFKLVVKNSRMTKLGDFRYPLKNQKPVISVNKDENSYRVLITFIHELAHLIVWLEEGKSRHPHGSKWKKTYGHLLHIFYQKNLIPEELSDAVYQHLIKPSASSYADVNLLKALRLFDPVTDKSMLLDLPEDQLFKLNNGKVFQKGEKRRTRILCTELSSKRKYLIHGHAEVVPVNY